MGIRQRFQELEPDKQLEICNARATEWVCFPPVFCQSLIPIAYLFVSWYYVIGAVALASLIWPLVRKQLASFHFATFGVMLAYLRWPVIVLIASYFAYEHDWGLTILTLCTTLIVLLMTLPLMSNQADLKNQLATTFMRQMGDLPQSSQAARL